LNPTQTDLFGAPSAPKVMPRGEKPAGYAGQPGSGPAGQTCGTCAFCRYRLINERRYYKCQRMSAIWSRNSTTDIRAQSPACNRFEPGTPRRTGIR